MISFSHIQLYIYFQLCTAAF